MADKTPIRMESAALDESEDKIVLRGVLTLDSLQHLLIDDYQREELTDRQRADIREALTKGEQLPDIQLGMRGEKHRMIRPNTFSLFDRVYIVDGQQRVVETRNFLSGNPGAAVRLGATVFFNTSKAWEKERFHKLNAKQTKVSPNVLLHNAREENKLIFSLYGLTVNENSFVMHDRVCWKQNMARGELITALTFLRVANELHRHKAGVLSGGIDLFIPGLDRMGEAVGVQNVRENIRTFWGLIDECWGIRRIHTKGTAPYIKGGFLRTLAKMLSDHHDFWPGEDEKRLHVSKDHRYKLSKFPIGDPEVIRLAGASG
ncbi:MAG TPA: hypothetical protein VJJ20_00140 [Candidatus Paceibacterota bacterium]